MLSRSRARAKKRSARITRWGHKHKVIHPSSQDNQKGQQERSIFDTAQTISNTPPPSKRKPPSATCGKKPAVRFT